MPRRILLLVTDLEIGGTPTVVRELAMRLAAPGVRVDVACLAADGPVGIGLRAAGVKVSAMGLTSPTQLPQAVSRLRRIIAAGGHDTVLSFLVHANAVAAGASVGMGGVRFIQSIQTTQPLPHWHWRVQAVAAGRCERLIAPSQAIIDVATRRSGISPGRFVVIPNAVDLADFSPHAVFAGQSIHAVFLGRLDPVKRVDIAIRAVANLAAAGRGITLTIYGDGQDRDRLQQLARNVSPLASADRTAPAVAAAVAQPARLTDARISGVQRPSDSGRSSRQPQANIDNGYSPQSSADSGGSDSLCSARSPAIAPKPAAETGWPGLIRFAGATSSPRAALADADVLLLPSLGEGFGLVLIEAMAAGVPVVASAGGAIPEVVEHETTGLLVDPTGDEPAGFADAIRRLGDDPTLRNRLIAAARHRVETHYAWPPVLQAYRSVLGIADPAAG